MTGRTRQYAGIGIIAASAACVAPAQETLSAAAHETTAARLERVAGAEEAHYEPSPLPWVCHAPGRPGDDVCWTSLVNPTQHHRLHALEHREEAARHRTAASALRIAEAGACAGIRAADRDESPFDHVEDIVRVEPLRGGVTRYLEAPQSEGVVVTFRAVPGMTVPWLAHLVDCQIARNAALGNDRARFKHCLLVPRGVAATVVRVPDGFAVTIRAQDSDTAHELFRRADVLVAEVRPESAP